MKISIITVVFNGRRTIEEAIQSVASQTYQNIEHIVIDGGSTDGTLDILKIHRNKLAKMVSERDNGIYDAMNKGIRLATGDVIGFLNSDDVYADASILSRVARVFSEHGVDACYGDLCYVDGKDLDKMVRYWRSNPYRRGMFALGWVPPHPTFFVKRKIYAVEGGFDISYRLAADFELMLRLLEVRSVRSHYIPRVLVKMRMGGATNKSWRNVLRQNREIVRSLREHGIPTSLSRYVLTKAVSRTGQYLRRPTPT